MLPIHVSYENESDIYLKFYGNKFANAVKYKFNVGDMVWISNHKKFLIKAICPIEQSKILKLLNAFHLQHPSTE